MAGKKKKPAANPARGFATTSVASKPKPEKPEDAISTEPSGVNTADPKTATPTTKQNGKTDIPKANTERDLHELSPEELEAQLEASELQQFIEQYAGKVRKESARHVSRLQTDKRLLRGQSEYMTVRDWLPEELMQQIVDYATHGSNESSGAAQRTLPKGDELLSKVWQLRLSLFGLDIPAERVGDAMAHILSNPPADEGSSQPWGLPEALDWLSWNCDNTELNDYDYEKPKPLASIQPPVDEDADSQDATTKTPKWKKPAVNKTVEVEQPGDDGVEVSDIDSDLEPDELLSVYLKTKVRLFDLDPEGEGGMAKKKQGKGQKGIPSTKTPPGRGQKKLQERVQRIESDVLFDKREGEAQWAEKKIDLTREFSERRKWQLQKEQEPKTQGVDSAKSNGLPTDNISDEAERLGQELLREAEAMGDDDMLGGMFGALPGSEETPTSGDSSAGVVHSQNVVVRDFGRLAGMNPKRVLEEACKARDSRTKHTYKLVSPTTFASRHSLAIQWSKESEPIDGEFMRMLKVEAGPTRTVITMMKEATPDTAQSEAYVATAALYLIFSGSPKEEKAHLKLPPAFRDLWDEFARLKRESVDAADRELVKELRGIVEKNVQPEVDDDDDDEIVYNPARRLNGAASGTATPSSRQDLQRPNGNEPSQALQEMWAHKRSSPAYQKMLQARMNLPMYQFRDEALDTIEKHQITILCGETGCGKSTQLPAFILENELSQGRHCKIYCTEPRRISAISLAQRVSEEMGERKVDVGTMRSLVGYAIRLESQTTANTRLVYATVGIVLRMLERSDGLSEITHLVLDEVHERSIDSDFLLIVLRTLLLSRPDLKVVLMSATVDAQRFSNYLDGAPIISVPGRTFPVQAKFLEDAIELTGHTIEDAKAQAPGGEEDDDIEKEGQSKSGDAQQLSAYSKRTKNTLANYDEYRIDFDLIVKLIEKVAYAKEYEQFSKAILVFLPGIAEIRQLNDMLQGHPSFLKGWRIHPLHSTFSSEDQQSAFEIPPPGTRKIVIATNIAETGITIPDVTCVVDTGKHKEMRFDERRQMSRLIQSFIARANAKQRRGRAGRVQEGICFHLFTKYRFDELMADAQTPEMLRLSLQDLVMRVKICKLGDIEATLASALDPPSSRNIRRAIDALIEVDALTTREELTPLGQQLAKLPLDAQLGKLILYGSIYGCLDFALTVAATLSSKTPFLSPMGAKKQADTVRLGFKRGDSDLLTAYNAYITWRKVCNTPGMSEYNYCNKNFLSTQNLANIEDLKGQLLMSLADAGFVSLGPEERQALSKMRYNTRQRQFVALPASSTRFDDNDDLANSVVAWSFYPKIGKREGKGWRNIANNQTLGLHPTSVNKTSLSMDVKYISFYSIMQSTSRFTNAQETSAVADFPLILLSGDAVFHMYAGVIIIDGNRLRIKVNNWKTMAVLKVLRARFREVLGRMLKYPGREFGGNLGKWMGVFEAIFARAERKSA
jgi:ATP-dependent RNA helicase DHX29